HAPEVLPAIIDQMVSARGADESTEWRQPADLIALCDKAAADLRTAMAAGSGGQEWSAHADLATALTGEDPHAVLAALTAAAADGATLADLGRALCYAAALRVARFSTANEHSDWESAHHVFTYCNAVHQSLKRIGSDPALAGGFVEAARALLHGAIAVYLIRYLN